MARVKGPLFSLEASGSLKKTITYSQWKGRNYVREHTIPFNPEADKQVNVRKAFTLLVAAWQELEAPAMLEWDGFGKLFNMSGFNTYLGRGMKEYKIQLTTLVLPVSCEVVGVAPDDVWTWEST